MTKMRCPVELRAAKALLKEVHVFKQRYDYVEPYDDDARDGGMLMLAERSTKAAISAALEDRCRDAAKHITSSEQFLLLGIREFQRVGRTRR